MIIQVSLEFIEDFDNMFYKNNIKYSYLPEKIINK